MSERRPRRVYLPELPRKTALRTEVHARTEMGELMEIEIRDLQDGDIGALAKIEAENFSMPWSENAFRSLLANPDCFYLVALADGEVAGGIGCTYLCGEASIDNVVVAQGWRRRGMAGALLKEVIARGEANRVEAFTLEVRAGNRPAICLYEKFGFRSAGIRPGFYEKPVEDALIMWRRKTD